MGESLRRLNRDRAIRRNCHCAVRVRDTDSREMGGAVNRVDLASDDGWIIFEFFDGGS